MNPEAEGPSELDLVQAKIAQLKESTKVPREPPQATPGLVFSMGFAVIGSLMAGETFGRYLSEKAGNPQYSLVGWVLGFGMAGLAVYQLLRPYMK